MTTSQSGDDTSAEVLEARVESLQAVVDRVLSWQESAPEGTVREELDKALDEVGLELDAPTRERIVEHVHSGAEHTDVRRFLS
jgi:hypothetical protein